MKTITIYELLGMVKDGNAPKKIKYNDYEYRYHDKEHGYCRSGYDCTYICLNTDYCLFNILNDEVEILEEEKKIPEKLTDILRIDDLIPPVDENMYKIWTQTIKNQNKINQVIDYLKSKGDE